MQLFTCPAPSCRSVRANPRRSTRLFVRRRSSASAAAAPCPATPARRHLPQGTQSCSGHTQTQTRHRVLRSSLVCCAAAPSAHTPRVPGPGGVPACPQAAAALRHPSRGHHGGRGQTLTGCPRFPLPVETSPAETAGFARRTCCAPPEERCGTRM